MSDVQQRTRQDAEDKALEFGCIAIFPEQDELFLDLDGDAQIRREVIDSLNQTGQVLIHINRLTTSSKSGMGQHVYLKLNSGIGDVLRLALQASLGSDPVKEALSVVREIQGAEVPCCLFELPGEAKRVALWRKRMKRAVWPKVEPADSPKDLGLEGL